MNKNNSFILKGTVLGINKTEKARFVRIANVSGKDQEGNWIETKYSIAFFGQSLSIVDQVTTGSRVLVNGKLDTYLKEGSKYPEIVLIGKTIEIMNSSKEASDDVKEVEVTNDKEWEMNLEKLFEIKEDGNGK